MSENVAQFPQLVPGSHYDLSISIDNQSDRVAERRAMFSKETDEYIEFIVNTLHDPYQINKDIIEEFKVNEHYDPSMVKDAKVDRIEVGTILLKDGKWINIYDRKVTLQKFSARPNR